MKFLQSEQAERALRSGNTRVGDYAIDDNAKLIGLHFSGHYTVPEVEALLIDLKAMQDAYDIWRWLGPGGANWLEK